jgi:hypothetical protein
MRALGPLLLVLSSCGALCPHQDALTGLDGGAVACVRATDCPLAANVLVCVNDEDRLRDCVACERNVCVRHQPRACP